jgi:hypothetical protein
LLENDYVLATPFHWWHEELFKPVLKALSSSAMKMGLQTS